MVTLANISWGSFGGYEGPCYYGRNFYSPPPGNTSFNDKCFAVVSSAEGTLSSINMYDRAIISVGAIQWTELTGNKVSEMIGFVAEHPMGGVELVLHHLDPALKLTGAEFKPNSQGKYRFFLDGVEVKGEALARKLYTGGSGPVGTWTEANKLRARTWCMCVANLFQDPGAEQAQVDFTAPKLRSFVFASAEKILFAPGTPETGLGGALKALYVGYAINLPAVADRVLSRVVAASKYPKWSDEWCLDVIHGIALTSGVSIWPGRYDAKRGPLEKFFGVTLPKNSSELARRSWQSKPATQVQPPVSQPVPPQTLPEPPVSVPPEEPKPAGVSAHPASELVLIRPDGQSVKPESPWMAILQWFPMLFGFVGHAINWVIHLIRGH